MMTNNKTGKTYESKRYYKDSERYTVDSLESGQTNSLGKLFFNLVGIQDHDQFNIVGTSIDTVRQLYFGKPKATMLEQLQFASENGEEFINIYGIKYHFTKMAKVSGFRYKLQNNENGLIFLFLSYYSKSEHEHTHLKVEVSPKLIAEMNGKSLQWRLNHYADLFLDEHKPRGVAIHLAADFQGWRPSNDFLSNFITYSRFNRVYDGVNEMELSDDWNHVSTRYGSDAGSIETIMFGKPTSLQTSLYLKSKEIVSSDKVDYFHGEWDTYSFGSFDPDQEVWRLEYRFHHTILREFGNSLGREIESYEQAYSILSDMWVYAIGRGRLELKKNLIHPIWQMLRDDSHFEMPTTGQKLIRTKKNDVSSLTKNYSLIIGNMITVCARQGFTLKKTMMQIKHLAFYDDILSNYRSRGKSEGDLREQIEKGLCLRRLIGKAA